MTRNARIEIEVDGDASGAVRAADRASRAYAGLGRDLDGVDRRSRATSGGLGGLAGGLSRLAGPAAIAGGALTVAAGAGFKLAEAASDAGEAASAAQQVFGSAYPEIERRAANAARTVGLSRTAYLDSAKTFGVLGQAAGLAGEPLGKFSTDMVALAGDLASFNNTSVDEAIAAIGSGLRGEAEPLRRFGILLDDATLRAKALELGLIKTTKDALTPQQKTLAAQAVILGQVGAAQGDFARTSQGMANQQRILKAESENLKAELGQGLLPVTNALMRGINDTLIPGLRGAAGAMSEGSAMSRLAGGAYDVYRGKTDKATAAQRLLGTAAQMMSAATRSVVSFIRGAATPVMQSWREGVDRVRDALNKHPRVLAVLKAGLNTLGGAMRQGVQIAGTLGKAAGSVLGAAFGVMTRAISAAIGLVDRLIGAWIRARNVVAGAVGRIKAAIRDLPGGGILSKVLNFTGPPLALAGGAAAGHAPALATAAASSWSTSTGSLWTSSAGAVIAAPQTTINIRVDGALDPIAVARQIEQLLARYGVLTGRR